jgi:hypothetical protein
MNLPRRIVVLCGAVNWPILPQSPHSKLRHRAPTPRARHFGHGADRNNTLLLVLGYRPANWMEFHTQGVWPTPKSIGPMTEGDKHS